MLADKWIFAGRRNRSPCISAKSPCKSSRHRNNREVSSSSTRMAAARECDFGRRHENRPNIASLVQQKKCAIWTLLNVSSIGAKPAANWWLGFVSGSENTYPLGLIHADRMGGPPSKVERNSARKRPTIINYHSDGPAVIRIDDRHLRPERQCAVRSRVTSGVKSLPAGSSSPGRIV